MAIAILTAAVVALAIQSPTPSDSQGFDPKLNHPMAAGSVAWVRTPAAYEVMDLYPHEAMVRNISGSATVRCHIQSSGRLNRCAVLNEKPGDVGFGDATRRVTKFFVAPAAAYGPDTTVDLQMQWTPQ